MRILIISLVMLLSSNLAAQNIKTAKTDNFEIQIELPEFWDIKVKSGRVSTVGPLPENIGINFVETTSSDLTSKYNQYVGDLKGGANFKVIQEGTTTINGQNYMWIEHESKNQGVKFHDRLYLTKDGNSLISITATSTQRRYQTHLTTLITIVESIRFK